MKARIAKKLSKKLAEANPKLFNGAWIDPDVMELAWGQGSRVSGCLSVGGHVNCWGEGTDHYTVLEQMKLDYRWLGDFPEYPDGGELSGYPDTRGFKSNGRNLLKIARKVKS